jgi:Tfp pilus assembly protein PilX
MKYRRQSGVTLILSLIMLVLLTIMALSTFNIGKSNLQIVDNAQQQGQAQNAAQAILEQVVSSPNFVENPAAVLDNSNCPAGAGAPANSRCVDVNGDGKTVVVVTLSPQPTCTKVKVIPAADLNVAREEDRGCTLGEQQNFGIEGVTTGGSLCSDSLWEISARATEMVSRAEAVVARGVSMRVSNDSVATACP